MKIDLKKTVLLFASIHLLIAWVAEREEKTKTKTLKISTRPLAADKAIAQLKTAMLNLPAWTVLENK